MGRCDLRQSRASCSSVESALAGRAVCGSPSGSSVPSASPLSPRCACVRYVRELVSRLDRGLRLVMGLHRGGASDLEFPFVRSSRDDIIHILHCGSLSVQECQVHEQETKEGKWIRISVRVTIAIFKSPSYFKQKCSRLFQTSAY